MSKQFLAIASTVIVLACVVAITILTAYHHPIPPVLPAVALGAFAGTFALLAVPGWGELAVGLAVIAGIFVLAMLSDTIPESLEELIVVALTGHFALSIPLPAIGSSSPPAASKAAPPAATPPAVASSSIPTIGG